MNKIAAGIVLYNPDIKRLNENVSSISSQVNIIILIDNGSTNIEYVQSFYADYKNLYIIKNKINVGIAKAMNQIIYFCIDNHIEWVLTLDQDSVCSSNFIESYLKFINGKEIGIITSKIVDRNYMNYNNNKEIIREYDYLERCISSGSLINVSLCNEIGLFDEKMFIDFVDFEYCARVIKAGYRIVRVNHAILLHQLGDLKVYSLLGKKIYVTNHSAIRKYYYVRNSIYYCNKHKDLVNKNFFYAKIIYKMLLVIIFENNKIKKLQAMIKGIKHGFQMK
jgi:rhamnosyltransferase